MVTMNHKIQDEEWDQNAGIQIEKRKKQIDNSPWVGDKNSDLGKFGGICLGLKCFATLGRRQEGVPIKRSPLIGKLAWLAGGGGEAADLGKIGSSMALPVNSHAEIFDMDAQVYLIGVLKLYM